MNIKRRKGLYGWEGYTTHKLSGQEISHDYTMFNGLGNLKDNKNGSSPWLDGKKNAVKMPALVMVQDAPLIA